jgi:hypothetical protein
MSRFLEEICDVIGVDQWGVTGPSRRREFARARQLAWYCEVIFDNTACAVVARRWGRDRKTVAHALAVVEWMRDDRVIDAWLELLEQQHHQRAERPARDAGPHPQPFPPLAGGEGALFAQQVPAPASPQRAT